MTKEEENYVTEYAARMVQEVMKFFTIAEKNRSKEVSHELSINFIASIIGAKVFLTLKEAAQSDSKIGSALNKFAELKIDIQNAVAAGFQGGMQEFSGQNLEYYCQVKLVPGIKNKMEC